MRNAALVLLSGGQDSTTCLFWAKTQFKRVEALSFDYGQRHKGEISCARAICESQEIPFHVLELPGFSQLAPNALTNVDIPLEDAPKSKLPSTFVEGRNLLFLSYAAIYAKGRGIRHLVTGVCETDFSGYPDCRDIFIKALDVTLNLAMEYPFVIETPLMWLTKAQTWALADDLGVLELVKSQTLTCYRGVPGEGCGACKACVLRQKGYEEFLCTKCEKP